MLNPDLYNRLQEIFGKVTAHSEDEPSSRLKFISGSVLKGQRVEPRFRPKGGEQYGVQCPFCGREDKLYISHMYGTMAKPPQGGAMVPCAKNVFHCYYCEFNKKDKKKYEKFVTLLDTGAKGDIVIDPELQRKAEEAMRNRRPEDHFPQCVPLHAPEAIHARTYLESRNFNSEDLVNNWGVLYSADPNYFNAPYVVFPIFVDGKLVTWQARYVGDDHDLRGCPKYYFDRSYKKTHVLYNRDRARHNTLGVLVEGIPSVVRIGPQHGIASFGKFPSARQLKILRGMYRYGTLVVIFDEDAREETRDQVKYWRSQQYFRNLINIELPDDNDPADYTTDAIWKVINRRVKETI